MASVFDEIDAILGKSVPAASDATRTIAPSVDLDTAIIDSANRFKLDPKLALAVAGQETGGLSSAERATAVSPKNATGLMQVMPETGAQIAAELNEPFTPDSLNDPATNARYGTYYLAKNKSRFADVPDEISDRLALVAYHAGPSGADFVYNSYKTSGVFEVPRTKRFWDGRKYTADYVEEVMERKDGRRTEAPTGEVAPVGSVMASVDQILAENAPPPRPREQARMVPPSGNIYDEIDALIGANYEQPVQPGGDSAAQPPAGPVLPGEPLKDFYKVQEVPFEEKPKMPGVLESVQAGAAGIGKAANKFLSYLVGNEYTAALLGIKPENRKAAAEAVQKAIAQPVDDLYKMTGMEKGAESQEAASKYLTSKEAWTKLENIPKTAKAVAAVAAYNGPQIVAAATPLVGQGSIIASEGGNWAEAAEQYGLDPKHVSKWMMTYAVPSGVIEVTTDKFLLGFGKLAKIDKAIGPISKKVAGMAAGKIAAPIVKTAAGGTVEGLEELFQGNLQFGTLYLALLDNAKDVAKTDPAKGQQLLDAARTLKGRYSLKGNFEDFFLGALVGTVYKGASVAAREVAERQAEPIGKEGPGVPVGGVTPQAEGGEETRIDILRRKIQAAPAKEAGPAPGFVRDAEDAELQRQRAQVPMVVEQPTVAGRMPTGPAGGAAEVQRIPPTLIEEKAAEEEAKAKAPPTVARYNPLRFNELAEKAGITTNKQLEAFKTALGTAGVEEIEEKYTGKLNDKEFEEFSESIAAGARVTDIPERMRAGLRQAYEAQGKEIPETLKPPTQAPGAPRVVQPSAKDKSLVGKLNYKLKQAGLPVSVKGGWQNPVLKPGPDPVAVFEVQGPEGKREVEVPKSRWTVDGIRNAMGVAVEPSGRRKMQVPVQEERRKGERRRDLDARKDVESMTPDEKTAALLTDEDTGLGSNRKWGERRRAFFRAEDEGKPAPQKKQAMIDVDGLKFINDNVSYEAGTELIKAAAEVLKEHGVDADRTGGDEIRAVGGEDLEQKIETARESLAKRVIRITLDNDEVVEFKGGFSYGTASNEIGFDEAGREAERKLHEEKRTRVESGLRAERGEQPPGFSRRTEGKGKEGGEGGGAAEPVAAGVQQPEEVEQEPAVGREGVGWEQGKARPIKWDPNSTANEGRFRLQHPDEFDEDAYTSGGKKTKFMSRNKKGGVEAEGVRFIVGKVNGEEKIQAIRFDKKVWDEERSSRWIAENANRLGRSDLVEKAPSVEQVADVNVSEEPVRDREVAEVLTGVLDEYGEVRMRDKVWTALGPEEKRSALQEKTRKINELLGREMAEANQQKLLHAKRLIRRAMRQPEVAQIGREERGETAERKVEKIAENKVVSQEAQRILDDAQKFLEGVNDDEVNAFLGTRYSAEALAEAREAIAQGEKDGKAAEEIRRQVARRLLQGVKIGDVIDEAKWFGKKPTPEEVTKMESEFGFEQQPEAVEEEPRAPSGELMFKREKEAGERVQKKIVKIGKIARRVIRKHLSPELAGRVRVRLSDEFNPGENAKIVFDKDGAIVTLDVNIAPEKIAEALVHEIPGHYGAIETMRQNAQIDARLRSTYKAAKGTRLMADLRDVYWDGEKTNEENERTMFLEWVAAQMERHALRYEVRDNSGKTVRRFDDLEDARAFRNENANRGYKVIDAKPDILAVRVWGAVKEWLISIGVKADNVDAVMRALVKEMKTANAQGTQAGVLASKYVPGDLGPAVFYRGTVSNETQRIKEVFGAARGKTFVARMPESARNYGENIERIEAKPDAKILYEEDAAFWNLVGRKKPANGWIGSATRKGESVIDAVNDAIRKADVAGYDIISFSQDADIGTVILNESAVTRAGTLFSREANRERPIAETGDLFEGTDLAYDVAKQKKKEEEAEIKRRLAESKGGRVDLENLPMFRGLEIEGAQQLTLFSKEQANENKRELAAAGVEFEDGLAVVYRGGNVPKNTLKRLRYNDYLSASKGMTDATGNAGAAAYGPNVVELKIRPEYLRVTNGELQYIGPSESVRAGKYPAKIYRAFNDVYGSNYTSVEIDAMPISEVRNTARMGLSGGFDEFDELVRSHPAKQTTLFSREAQPYDKTLVALHNLNQDSILFADKLGGLPAPSIAVTKAGMPFSGYGDVTLIAKKDAIDPKYTKVYNADIYSGRSPEVEHDIDKKAKNAFRTKLWNARRKYEDSTGEARVEEGLDRADRERFVDAMKNDHAVMGMYLEENGVKVDPTRVPKGQECQWSSHPAVIAWNKAYDHNRLRDAGYDDPYRIEYAKAGGVAVRKAIDDYVKEVHGEENEEGMRDLVKVISKKYMGDDGVLYGSEEYKISRDIYAVEHGETEVDKKETRTKIEAEIDRLGRGPFGEWVESQAREIFYHPHLKKGRTKLPLTLENFVDLTVGRGVRSKEKNFVFGIGQARSVGTNRLSSFEAMHREEGKLVSKEEMEKAKDEAQKLWDKIAAPLTGYYGYKDANPFSKLDELSKTIADYFKGARTVEGMRRAMYRHDYGQAADSHAEDMRDLAEHIRNMPTEYFEAKPERGVRLNEFVGAVIPEGTSADVRDVLAKNGVETVEYKPGDVEDRTTKTKSFATEKQALFSKEKVTAAKQLSAEEIKEYSIDPEEVPVGKWAGRVMFHGTSADGAEGIVRDGVDVDKSTGGYFGKGFYLASDVRLAQASYADMNETGEPGDVVAVQIGPDAKIADLRNPEDFDKYMKASNNGGDIWRPDFDKRMVAAGIDGLFDRSFGGLVIYNPKVLKVAGKRSEILFSKEKPFFSPTLRAVEGLKQDKGAGDQMWAMIQKTPGVKKAETDWLGLEEWLKGKKSVTKGEIEEFVRSNQVEVQEVEKGAGDNYDWKADLNDNETLTIDNEKFARVSHDGESWKVYFYGDKSTEGGFNTKERAREFAEKESPISLGSTRYLGATKFSTYQLPGGEGYREVLLTLPQSTVRSVFEKTGKRVAYGEAKKYDYRSSHWDEPNVIAHVRMNDREGPSGEKVLFVEEIQSDWAREARAKGVQGQGKFKAVRDDQFGTWHIVDVVSGEPDYSHTYKTEAEASDYAAEVNRKYGVPAQPFLKNWEELTLKRVLRMAAEEGYDRVAWINGEQTAERYDLSKQIDKIQWGKNEDGTFQVVPIRDGREITVYNDVKPDDLARTIGKDVAQRIVNASESAKEGELSGQGLKVGGEWATALYDRMIPGFLNRYAKKWGAQVEPVELGFEVTVPEARRRGIPITTDKALVAPETQQSLPITPAMRESVMQGQPLFAKERVDQTETPELKAWFGNSKVADEAGRPLAVYHATIVGRKFNEFDTSKEGAHFGTAEQAGNLSGYKRAKPMPFFLSIQNPLRMRDIGVWNNFDNFRSTLVTDGVITTKEADEIWDAWNTSDDAGWNRTKDVLRQKGYDGVVYENEQEGAGDSYIAFSPAQIKSAIGNIGTFDPTSPDVRYSKERVDPVTRDYMQRLEKEIRKTRGKLKRVASEEAIQDRSAIQLWMDGLPNDTKDKLISRLDELSKEKASAIRQAVIDYAQKIGLRGEPYNRVDTLVKNTVTIRGFQKALDIMDEVMQARTNNVLRKKVLELVERQYRRQRGVEQGKIRSPYTAETERALADYLDTLKVQNDPDVDLILAYWGQYGKAEMEANHDRAVSQLGADAVAWLEDPSGDPPAGIKERVAKIFRPALGSMNSQQLLQVMKDIREIQRHGRLHREVTEGARVAILEDKAVQVAADIRAAMKKSPEHPAVKALSNNYNKKVMRRLGRVPEMFGEELLYNTLDPERVIEGLVDFKASSPLKSLLWDPLWKANVEKLRNLEKALDQFKEFYKGIDIVEARTKPWKTYTIDGKVGEKDFGMVELKVTLENAMTIYAYAQSDGGRRHLQGTGILDGVIGQVVNDLPQKYKDAVDAQMRYYDDTQYDRVNKVFLEQYGIDMPSEEGYMPINAIKAEHAESDVLTDLMAHYGAKRANVQKGFVKSRVKSMAGFRHLNYFDVVLKNLMQIEHYIAFQTPINNVQRVLNNAVIRNAIREKSEVAYRVLQRWVNTMAVGKMERSEHWYDKAADAARHNYAVYVLGFKLTSILMQTGSFPKAIAFVGKRNMAMSIAAFAKNPVKFMEDIDAKSAPMKARMRNFEREIVEQAENQAYARALGSMGFVGKSRDAAMWVMGAYDKLLSGLVWHAGYRKALNASMDEESAIDAADEAVRKTQSGGGLITLPALYRGPGVVRLFSMFRSDANKTFNLAYEIAHKAKQQSPGATAEQIFWVFVAAPLVAGFMRNAFKWPWEEPEEYGKELVRNVSDGIPLLGDALQAATNMGLDKALEARGGKPDKWWVQYIGDMDLPGISAFGDLTEGLAREKPDKVADAVAQLMGVPGYNQGKRFVAGAKKMGEEGPNWKYLVWPAGTVKVHTVERAMIERWFARKKEEQLKARQWFVGLTEEQRKEFAKKLVEEYKKRSEKKQREKTP